MLIINIMSLTYNKKVLEQLRETKRTSPNTSSITLDYMYLLYNIGKSEIYKIICNF